MKPVSIYHISIAVLAVHCLALSDVSIAKDLGQQQVIQDGQHLDGPDHPCRESFAHETKANNWQNGTFMSSNSPSTPTVLKARGPLKSALLKHINPLGHLTTDAEPSDFKDWDESGRFHASGPRTPTVKKINDYIAQTRQALDRPQSPHPPERPLGSRLGSWRLGDPNIPKHFFKPDKKSSVKTEPGVEIEYQDVKPDIKPNIHRPGPSGQPDVKPKVEPKEEPQEHPARMLAMPGPRRGSKPGSKNKLGAEKPGPKLGSKFRKKKGAGGVDGPSHRTPSPPDSPGRSSGERHGRPPSPSAGASAMVTKRSEQQEAIDSAKRGLLKSALYRHVDPFGWQDTDLEPSDFKDWSEQGDTPGQTGAPSSSGSRKPMIKKIADLMKSQPARSRLYTGGVEPVRAERPQPIRVRPAVPGPSRSGSNSPKPTSPRPPSPRPPSPKPNSPILISSKSNSPIYSEPNSPMAISPRPSSPRPKSPIRVPYERDSPKASSPRPAHRPEPTPIVHQDHQRPGSSHPLAQIVKPALKPAPVVYTPVPKTAGKRGRPLGSKNPPNSKPGGPAPGFQRKKYGKRPDTWAKGGRKPGGTNKLGTKTPGPKKGSKNKPPTKIRAWSSRAKKAPPSQSFPPSGSRQGTNGRPPSPSAGAAPMATKRQHEAADSEKRGIFKTYKTFDEVMEDDPDPSAFSLLRPSQPSQNPSSASSPPRPSSPGNPDQASASSGPRRPMLMNIVDYLDKMRPKVHPIKPTPVQARPVSSSQHALQAPGAPSGHQSPERTSLSTELTLGRPDGLVKQKKKPGPPKGRPRPAGSLKPGPPKGQVRPYGSMKPGPPKGRPRDPNAPKPGPRKGYHLEPGYQRPPNASKPGPKKGQPRPHGSMRPGPPKGRPRDPKAQKPGPRKGYHLEPGYQRPPNAAKSGPKGPWKKRPRPSDGSELSHQPSQGSTPGSPTSKRPRPDDDAASPRRPSREPTPEHPPGPSQGPAQRPPSPSGGSAAVSVIRRDSDLQQLSPRLGKKFKLKEKVKKVFRGGSSKPKPPSDSSSSPPSPAPEASSPQKTYESSPSQPSLSAGELARLQEELKTKLQIERVHSWVDHTVSAGPASPNRYPSPSVSQTHSRSRTPSRSPSRHSSPSSNRRRDLDEELQARWFKHLAEKVTQKATRQRVKQGAKKVVKKVFCKHHAKRDGGQMVKRCFNIGSDSSRRSRERSRRRVDRWRGMPRQHPEEQPWAGASPTPSGSHHSGGSAQQGSQQASPQQGSPQQVASPQPSEGAVSITVSPTQSPPAGSDNNSER